MANATSPKFKNVYWLGAERNEGQGDARPMQTQLEDYLATGNNRNQRHFRILVAQMTSLGLIEQRDQPPSRKFRSGIKVVIDDLGAPAGGAMNHEAVFVLGVEDRRKKHLEKIKTHDFDTIVVGGGLAFKTFVGVLAPHIESITRGDTWVVGTRNPSPQAHRSAPEYWLQCYGESHLRDAIEQDCAKKSSPPHLIQLVHNTKSRFNASLPKWRVERKVRHRR